MSPRWLKVTMAVATATVMGGLVTPGAAFAATGLAQVRVCSSSSTTLYAQLGGRNQNDVTTESRIFPVPAHDCYTLQRWWWQVETSASLRYGRSPSGRGAKNTAFNIPSIYSDKIYTLYIHTQY
jgi:hypothetical protein